MSISKGFTLIEVLIVVVIVSILTIIAVPRYARISDLPKESEAQLLLRQLMKLELAYKEKYGSYADIDNLPGLLDPSPIYYTASINNSPKSFTAILQAKSQYINLRDFYITEAGKILVYSP